MKTFYYQKKILRDKFRELQNYCERFQMSESQALKLLSEVFAERRDEHRAASRKCEYCDSKQHEHQVFCPRRLF